MTGGAGRVSKPRQVGVRRSHSLTVLSREPDMKPSSTGDISSDITRPLWPLKYERYLLSCKEWYRIPSSSFVDAWIIAVFLWVKRGRSIPYFLDCSVFKCLPQNAISEARKKIMMSELACQIYSYRVGKFRLLLQSVTGPLYRQSIFQ